MKIDFATFVYWADVNKLHAEGVLAKMVRGHGYPFSNVIVVHQRCRDIVRGKDGEIRYEGAKSIRPILDIPNLVFVQTEDSPNILTEFRIPENDPDADFWTHGPKSAHYWKWHVINHLNAVKASNADYIVFSDSDITMVKNGPPSWVEKGVECLKKYPEVFMVSPDEGGAEVDRAVPEGRMVKTVSQQIFLVDRKRFMEANFAVPYDSSALHEDPSKRKSTKLAPFGPLQEFYFMLEGRIWRWIDSQGLYRLMLKPQWRYWHWQGKIGGQ
jgi:hypothetical protein